MNVYATKPLCIIRRFNYCFGIIHLEHSLPYVGRARSSAA
ncbi:hypothetical protein J671_2446 [Acinetobacter sp. 1130196]|nr:hypothetical protein J671_2446 [Acinetobacter sp. 1130196]